MTDLLNNLQQEEKQIEKRKVGAPSKYAPELWNKAKDLVENSPDKTLTEIALELNMPLTTLESRASRHGWLANRDVATVKNAEKSLMKVTREVAFQINDIHSHSIAMIKALQYSHRIKILRDDEGRMDYVNFDDWPDKPANWDTLSSKDKEAHRLYISPTRLKAFRQELETILVRKQETLEFIAKYTKASFPKVDPGLLSVKDREADGEEQLIDNTGLFKGPELTMEDAIKQLIEKEEDN